MYCFECIFFKKPTWLDNLGFCQNEVSTEFQRLKFEHQNCDYGLKREEDKHENDNK